MKQRFFSRFSHEEAHPCGAGFAQNRGRMGRHGRLFGGRFGGMGPEGLRQEGFGPQKGGRESRGLGRGLGHGGLRLVLLKLLDVAPSHGYELIKQVESRFKGEYSPSPGVVYPTLNWLEDEGLITLSPGADGRKQAEITEAGRTFLVEHAEEVDRLLSHMEAAGAGQRDYGALFRAMHNLKTVLRACMSNAPDKGEIEAIVDMIDDLAKRIERR